MKAKLIAVSLVLAARAFASTTNVDLGPDGTYFNKVYGFDGLTGTVMNGQSVTLDLNFNTSVHLFQRTRSMIGLSFLASTSNPGFITGIGCVLDSAGQPMDALTRLGSADSDQGELFCGLFPITRPLDFYGAHFELTLPDNGLTITDGLLQLFASDYSDKGNPAQGFRIGSHVPDTGSTGILLALALALLLLRIRMK